MQLHILQLLELNWMGLRFKAQNLSNKHASKPTNAKLHIWADCITTITILLETTKLILGITWQSSRMHHSVTDRWGTLDTRGLSACAFPTLILCGLPLLGSVPIIYCSVRLVMILLNMSFVKCSQSASYYSTTLGFTELLRGTLTTNVSRTSLATLFWNTWI